MRKEFCEGMCRICDNASLVFLTGDLGYGVLEPLRDRLRDRFINAGVAEQNMVSCGAGLARCGFRPWLYSIAPFLYARAFEQIRNDVCLHNLPVVLVGNGGGYGYGVMGATHHAIEDYGVLLCLPSLKIVIPAFDADLRAVLPKLIESSSPAYLRMGVQDPEWRGGSPCYQPWRRVLAGGNGNLVAVGPLAGLYWSVFQGAVFEDRPSIWALCELPMVDVPQELLAGIESGAATVFAEEHVAIGSAGHQFVACLVKKNISMKKFIHLTAAGYPSGRYGSQAFHRAESGLCGESVRGIFHALKAD